MGVAGDIFPRVLDERVNVRIVHCEYHPARLRIFPKMTNIINELAMVEMEGPSVAVCPMERSSVIRIALDLIVKLAEPLYFIFPRKHPNALHVMEKRVSVAVSIE